MSEPIDPATVTTKNVEMYEVFADATNSGELNPPSAPAGHFGTPVSYKVPITVEVDQGFDSQGLLFVKVVVIPHRLKNVSANSRVRW